jgi:TP901 family phage tail tape measure protein
VAKVKEFSIDLSKQVEKLLSYFPEMTKEMKLQLKVLKDQEAVIAGLTARLENRKILSNEIEGIAKRLNKIGIDGLIIQRQSNELTSEYKDRLKEVEGYASSLVTKLEKAKTALLVATSPGLGAKKTEIDTTYGKAAIADTKRTTDIVEAQRLVMQNAIVGTKEYNDALKTLQAFLAGTYSQELQRTVADLIAKPVFRELVQKLLGIPTDADKARAQTEYKEMVDTQVRNMKVAYEQSRKFLATTSKQVQPVLPTDVQKSNAAFRAETENITRLKRALEDLQKYYLNVANAPKVKSAVADRIKETEKELQLSLGTAKAHNQTSIDRLNLETQIANQSKLLVELGGKEYHIGKSLLDRKSTSLIQAQEYLKGLQTQVGIQRQINTYVAKEQEISNTQINSLERKQVMLLEQLKIKQKLSKVDLIDKKSMDNLNTKFKLATAEIKKLNIEAGKVKFQRDIKVASGVSTVGEDLRLTKINALLNIQYGTIKSIQTSREAQVSLQTQVVTTQQRLVELGIKDTMLLGVTKKAQEEFLINANRKIQGTEKLVELERQILELRKGYSPEKKQTKELQIAQQYADLLRERQVIEAKLTAYTQKKIPANKKEVARLKEIQKITKNITAQKKIIAVLEGRSPSILEKIRSKHKSIMTIMFQRLRFIATAGLAYKLQNNFLDMYKKSLTETLKLEKEIAEVGTLQVENLQEVNAILAIYKRGIIELSERYGDETSKLTKALYDIRSATVPTTQALKMLEVVTRAGKASLTDAAQAAKPIIAIMNAYKMEVEDAEYISDMLFATIQRGVTTMKELAPNIGKAIAAAAMVGVDAPQVLAMVSSTTRMGVSTRETITAINRLMLNFSKQTEAARLIAMKYGFTLDSLRGSKDGLVEVFYKMQHATDQEKIALVGSVRAFKAMAAGVIDVKGQMFDLNYIRNASGKTIEAMEKIEQTVSFKAERIKQTIHAALLKFGDLLIPIFSNILNWIEKLDSSGIVDKMKKLTGWIVAALGAFAGYEVITLATMAFVNLSAALTGLKYSMMAVKHIGFMASFVGTGGWIALLKALIIPLSIFAGILAKNAVARKFAALEEKKSMKESEDNAKKRNIALIQEARTRQDNIKALLISINKYKELDSKVNKSVGEQKELNNMYETITISARSVGYQTGEYTDRLEDLSTMADKAETKLRELSLIQLQQEKILLEGELAKVIPENYEELIYEKFKKFYGIYGNLSEEFRAHSLSKAISIADIFISTDEGKSEEKVKLLIEEYYNLFTLRASISEISDPGLAKDLDMSLAFLKPFKIMYETVGNTKESIKDIIALIEELGTSGKDTVFTDTQRVERTAQMQDELEKFKVTIQAKKDAAIDKAELEFFKRTKLFIRKKGVSKDDIYEAITSGEEYDVKDFIIPITGTTDEDFEIETEKYQEFADALIVKNKLIVNEFDLQILKRKTIVAQQEYELGISKNISTIQIALSNQLNKEIMIAKAKNLWTQEEEDILKEKNVRTILGLQLSRDELELKRSVYLTETRRDVLIHNIVLIQTELNHLTDKEAKTLKLKLKLENNVRTEMELILDLAEKIDAEKAKKDKATYTQTVAELNTEEWQEKAHEMNTQEILDLLELNKTYKSLSEDKGKYLKWELAKRSLFSAFGIQIYKDEADARVELESKANELVGQGINYLLNTHLAAIEKRKEAELKRIEDTMQAEKDHVAGTLLTEGHKTKVYAAIEKKAAKDKEEAEAKYEKKRAQAEKNKARNQIWIDLAKGIVGIWSSHLGLPTALPFVGILTINCNCYGSISYS